MTLAELLVQSGLLNLATIESLVDDGPTTGAALIERVIDEGLVPEDELAELLARETQTVVVDLAQGALDPDAMTLVEPALCRDYLLIPLASDPAASRIRVAFANPLDLAGAEAVGAATGLAVECVVCTLGELREALDKSLPDLPTVSALEPEGTIRMGAPAGASDRLSAEPIAAGGTSPTRQSGEGGTTEQRQEALILALIERGVITRGDFEDALARLLKIDGA